MKNYVCQCLLKCETLYANCCLKNVTMIHRSQKGHKNETWKLTKKNNAVPYYNSSCYYSATLKLVKTQSPSSISLCVLVAVSSRECAAVTVLRGCWRGGGTAPSLTLVQPRGAGELPVDNQREVTEHEAGLDGVGISRGLDTLGGHGTRMMMTGQGWWWHKALPPLSCAGAVPDGPLVRRRRHRTPELLSSRCFCVCFEWAAPLLVGLNLECIKSGGSWVRLDFGGPHGWRLQTI
ncbi:hypothetical protein BS78_06G019600 [Paspalum vaginatum]|nr:hypothetical protein BS78_06G019600 [Paspalum vaginatum]